MYSWRMSSVCRLDDERHLTKSQIKACRGHLEAQIKAVQPKVIVPLGSTAWSWFNPGDKRRMAEVRGAAYRWRAILLVPTYHPAFLLRKPEHKADVWQDVQVVRAVLHAGGDACEYQIHHLHGRSMGEAEEPSAPTLF